MSVLKTSLAAFLFVPLFAQGAEVTFTSSQIGPRVDGATDVVAADIDNDGNLDVVATSFVDDDVVWLRNPGGDFSGEWEQVVIENNIRDVSGVEVADFDSDGDIDVVVAATDTSDGDVVWYENPLIGDNEDWEERILEQALDGAVEVAVSDINQDGNMDIVAVGTIDDDVIWLRNPGVAEVRDNSAWETFVIDQALNGARAVSIGDIDGDGIDDVVASGRDENSVMWYRNVGGTEVMDDWDALEVGDSVANPNGLSIADYDEDGANDVTVVSESDNSVTVFFGSTTDPGNEFEEVEILDANRFGNPAFVETADLDLDGDLDFAVTVNADDGIFYFDNPGGSAARDADSWMNTEVFDPNAPIGLVIADFDANGSPDIVTTSFLEDEIILLLNNTPPLVAPVVSSIVEVEGGGFEITFNADAGVIYRVDSSMDLITFEEGTPMAVAAGGVVTVPIPAVEGAERLFYRVVAVSR